jgi:hypothetical protein
MKVNSTIYKGIEYVQVSALPADQKEKLLQTINRDLFIKILVDEKLVSNCLLFKDYEIWFENVYQVQRKQSESPNKVKTITTGVSVESLKKA